jgi:hypothetical protein
MLKFSFLLLLAVAFSATAHAQLTIEELVALRGQAKLDAVSFLQGKGFKLDSCVAPEAGAKDLSSVCYFHIDKVFDQRKATSTLEVAFSIQKKNELEYVPLQQGFSARVMQYMKSLRAREEPYDLIKEQKFGKKFYLEGWVYDVQQSLKNPEIETIFIIPAGVK